MLDVCRELDGIGVQLSAGVGLNKATAMVSGSMIFGEHHR